MVSRTRKKLEQLELEESFVLEVLNLIEHGDERTSSSSLTHLEELDSDAGEHELKQRCDDHDVPDSPDGHEHTLDNMLQHKDTNKYTPESTGS